MSSAEHNINNNNDGDDEFSSSVAALRSSLRSEYPEIDELYSDSYLQSVIDVPGRSFDYARDEKIRGALEWRRSYGVDGLISSFVCDEGDDGTFSVVESSSRSTSSSTSTGAEEQSDPCDPCFVPTPELIQACKTGAFRVGGFDDDGRIILQARTALFNWWSVGVEAGIQYHVLVIEHALQMMMKRNTSEANEGNNGVIESMVLFVDTADASLVPPPMGTLTGFASLLQRAYPDRINKIYVGSVNSLLRQLYQIISPYLRPRSRDKIVLLPCSPSREAVAEHMRETRST